MIYNILYNTYLSYIITYIIYTFRQQKKPWFSLKDPNGIPTRSMENIRWHSPSQVLTAKHVLYPQLTATHIIHMYIIYIYNILADSKRSRGSVWKPHVDAWNPIINQGTF